MRGLTSGMTGGATSVAAASANVAGSRRTKLGQLAAEPFELRRDGRRAGPARGGAPLHRHTGGHQQGRDGPERWVGRHQIT